MEFHSHKDTVMQIIERSVTGFSLDIRLHPRQNLPNIWVNRQKLYQYRALPGGVGKKYQLSYHKRQSREYDYFFAVHKLR
jgi:hypothetical protein